MRRIARERALQFLFGLDFTSYEWGPAVEEFWEDNPVRPTVRKYGQKLIKGVMENREAIDAAIHEALDNWSPGRVGRIELNVIRVAFFEMAYCPDVPPTVAISEAIEVAKRYGSEESPRFVNGVLDRLKRNRDAQQSAGEDP